MDQRQLSKLFERATSKGVSVPWGSDSDSFIDEILEIIESANYLYKEGWIISNIEKRTFSSTSPLLITESMKSVFNKNNNEKEDLLKLFEDLSFLPPLKLLKSRILINNGFNEEGIELVDELINDASTLQHFHSSKKAYRLMGLVVQANAYINLGHYDKAESLLKEAISLEPNFIPWEELHEYPYKELTYSLRFLNTFGRLMYVRGELDSALEYYTKSLGLLPNIENQNLTNYEDLVHHYFTAQTLENMGKIFVYKNQFEKGIQSLNESLAISKKVGNELKISGTLFVLIRAYLENFNEENLIELLNQLKSIREKTKNNVIELRYLLAQALYLKHKNRARNKVEAQTILAKIIEEKIIDQELHLLATEHLIELLIDEYKTYNEEEVNQELTKLISNLLEFGQRVNSYLIIVESLILQSKLNLIKGNIDDAFKDLQVAKNIVIKNKLKLLNEKVDNEISTLESQFNHWKAIVSNNESFQRRLEKSQFSEYVKYAQELMSEFKVMKKH